MNKEIEEMASDMDYGCAKRDLYPDDAKEIAKVLYLLGYQKIDKDKQVVLTKEEYEQLKQTIISQSEESTKLCTHLTQKIIDTRKETAREILQEFKKWAKEYYSKDTVIGENGERPMTNNEKLNYLYTYLCDKYKVEIKE